MEVVVDYSNLPAGQVIEIKGKQLGMVRHINDFAPKEDGERADGTANRGWSVFSVGGRGFQIDDHSEDDIEMLKDKVKRRGIASLFLEATEYARDIEDPVTGEPTGQTETRKGFRFLSLVTVEDAIAYANAEGQVAKVEQGFAPKVQPINTDKMAEAIALSLGKLLAPKPAVAEPVEA